MGLFNIFKKKPDYSVPWPDVVKRTFEEDNEIHEILQKFADGRINAREIDPNGGMNLLLSIRPCWLSWKPN